MDSVSSEMNPQRDATLEDVPSQTGEPIPPYVALTREQQQAATIGAEGVSWPEMMEAMRIMAEVVKVVQMRSYARVFDDPTYLGREHALRVALNRMLAGMLSTNAAALEDLEGLTATLPAAICQCGGKVPVTPYQPVLNCEQCTKPYTARWSKPFVDGRPQIEPVDLAGPSIKPFDMSGDPGISSPVEPLSECEGLYFPQKCVECGAELSRCDGLTYCQCGKPHLAVRRAVRCNCGGPIPLWYQTDTFARSQCTACGQEYIISWSERSVDGLPRVEPVGRRPEAWEPIPGTAVVEN